MGCLDSYKLTNRISFPRQFIYQIETLTFQSNHEKPHVLYMFPNAADYFSPQKNTCSFLLWCLTLYQDRKDKTGNLGWCSAVNHIFLWVFFFLTQLHQHQATSRAQPLALRLGRGVRRRKWCWMPRKEPSGLNPERCSWFNREVHKELLTSQWITGERDTPAGQKPESGHREGLVIWDVTI